MTSKNGFFISCFRNRETQAYNNFLMIAEPYTESFKVDTLDFTKLLEQEKNEAKKFAKYNIKNLKNVVLIENRTQMDVVQLYNRLKNTKSKYIQRLMPLQMICDVCDYKENIERFINGYISKITMFDAKSNLEPKTAHVNADEDFITKEDETEDKENNLGLLQKGANFTYKIMIEDRLTDKETKKEIFDYSVSKMKGKVNLKSPDYVFVIQICKIYVGLAFLRFDPKNFNINNRTTQNLIAE